MPTDRFDFPGTGGHRLSGRLERPDGAPRGWALFAHCFTCGKDNLAAVHIARRLAREGIGTLRFDFAGLGTSEGAFAEQSFASEVADLVAAGRALDATGMPASLLIGHSLGGAAALAAAGELPQVKAVATIAAPFEVAHVLDQFAPGAVARIEAEGAAEVILGGRPFTVGKAFIDDLRGHDQCARIAALHRPLLILHAPHDETVGIANATRIFMAAHHPRSFIALDGADHLLSRTADADYAASLIATWAARYLPAAVTQSAASSGAVATTTGGGHFQVEIEAGSARFFADEPASAGGLGSGPSPYDLLSAALAACTTMTLRRYAEGKGWPVAQVRTTVGHSRDPAEAIPDLFSRRIAVEGPLDAAQRQRMVEIADHCPVHRTLARGARFESVASDEVPASDPPEAHAQAVERTADGAS